LLGNNVPDPFEVDGCSFEIPWTWEEFEADFPAAADAGNFTSKECEGHEGARDFMVYRVKVPTGAMEQEPIDDIKALRTAVDGAMKVPTMRMVEHTWPYWHHGGERTLTEVVQFYDRGGNYTNDERDPDIQVLNLTEEEEALIVKFLKALTDKQAIQNMAPFDMPEILVPHGGDEQLGGFKRVPAIGAAWGRPAVGLPPWNVFLANPGDIDEDGDVDINDINYIFIAFFTWKYGPTDLLEDALDGGRDVNKDNMITYADVIAAVGPCTNPGCAP